MSGAFVQAIVVLLVPAGNDASEDGPTKDP